MYECYGVCRTILGITVVLALSSMISVNLAHRMCSSLDELKELERFTEEEVAGMQRTGSSSM